MHKFIVVRKRENNEEIARMLLSPDYPIEEREKVLLGNYDSKEQADSICDRLNRSLGNDYEVRKILISISDL